jgi:4-hydroxy-tetrahydrodipicolinate reductase
MTKIILNGCNGKMGKTIVELSKSFEDVTIVAGIDVLNQEESYFPIFTHPSNCDVDADVLIDFSRPSALQHVLELAKRKSVGVVVATTGLDETHHKIIEEASKVVPILLSANMSLGVNLLLDLVSKAAQILSKNYDIEILEKHHNSKEDAPSGTALMIADAINLALDNKKEYVYERASKRQKRDRKELGIHSIRGGTIVGEHDVIFSGFHEVIEISHKAYSRDIFASGALQASLFLKNQKPGLYNMKDLVNVE